MGRSRGPVLRRAGAGVVGVLVVAGLVGCGPGTQPSPAPTSTGPVDPSPRERITTLEPTVYPRQTPDPRPEAVPPERPAAMDQVDVAGAEAVATYFLHLHPYVYATGDLTAWRELSHPECDFCENVSSDVADLFAKGQVTLGATMTLGAPTVRALESEGLYLVELEGTQAPWVLFDSNGAQIKSVASPKTYAFDVVVIRDSGVWLVRAVDAETFAE